MLVGLDDGVVDFMQVKETGYEDIICDKIHNSRITGLGYDSLIFAIVPNVSKISAMMRLRCSKYFIMTSCTRA